MLALLFGEYLALGHLEDRSLADGLTTLGRDMLLVGGSLLLLVQNCGWGRQSFAAAGQTCVQAGGPWPGGDLAPWWPGVTDA